jgi:lysine-specific permease
MDFSSIEIRKAERSKAEPASDALASSQQPA